ncbi:MAG: Lrp/AsnC family transcriptional regulator [Lachnospiraceae bacterium]|nr:Lrp/AsnC family transcriptional regulator [Lachnospiraceae bacterium]
MNELLKLLKDGKSRTLEMLAIELDTSIENVKRDIDFLERMNVIKRIEFTGNGNSNGSCDGCNGCGTGKKTCDGCMPKGGFQNMGIMWEVADN